MGLPGSVVARRVRAVELEALNSIVASVHEGNAEGTAATVEGVHMLLVCEVADELLDVDGLTLAVELALCMDTANINEHISIGNNTRNRDEHVVVHLVKFSTLTSGHEESRCFLLLSGENDT